VDEYEWPVAVWAEGLSPFLEEAGGLVDMPRIPNEEYGARRAAPRHAERWRQSMPVCRGFAYPQPPGGYGARGGPRTPGPRAATPRPPPHFLAH
jgi:hypothetical protein